MRDKGLGRKDEGKRIGLIVSMGFPCHFDVGEIYFTYSGNRPLLRRGDKAKLFQVLNAV
jgi:hypothetical protein